MKIVVYQFYFFPVYTLINLLFSQYLFFGLLDLGYKLGVKALMDFQPVFQFTTQFMHRFIPQHSTACGIPSAGGSISSRNSGRLGLRRLFGAAALTGGLMLSAPAANATAIFDAIASYSDDATSVYDWYYSISDSDPGNGDSCFSDGTSFLPEGSVTTDEPYATITAVTLDPPFSGSASATKYLTVCKDDDYLVVKMTISVSSCLVWICTTDWASETLESAGTFNVSSVSLS